MSDPTILQQEDNSAYNDTLREVSSPSSASRDLQIPGVTSLEPLNRGAEAELYKADWNGSRVVVKWFKKGIIPNPDIAGLIQRLDRKCVVQVLSQGSWDDRAYEILEYIEHGSLAELLQAKRNTFQAPTGNSRVRNILEELTGALEALHAINIIHRDIKPGNILIRSREPLDLVLADFGISSLTNLPLQSATIYRTPTYSAPESDTGVISKESDWWSIGMIVLELLTGRTGFEYLDAKTIEWKKDTVDIHIPDNLTDEWKHLLQGLLNRNPAKRWGAKQIRDWLNIKPYIFGGNSYYSPTSLVKAFNDKWSEGLKEFEQIPRLIAWLKDDLRDSEKASKLSSIKEFKNKNLTEEMRFAISLVALDPQHPFFWRGEIVDGRFAHSNGEVMWELLDAGINRHLPQHSDVLSMLEIRQREYLERISKQPGLHDQKIAKKSIGFPDELLKDAAIERADERYTALRKSLPECMRELPDFRQWFIIGPSGASESLAILSCKQGNDDFFVNLFQEYALNWLSNEEQKNKPRWKNLSKSLKKKNSKTSDILLLILLGPIIVLCWITKISWRHTKSILKAGSAVNQVKTSPILDNSMPIILQHTLIFVTFPSILAGLMIGILLPLIGLLKTSILFILPFFYNDIISKRDYGKIINCSNFCFNILPTSISNSRFFNIIFSSNFLIGLANEWSNYSNCKSLFIYMYALMSAAYFLYYFFTAAILNFL
jgi:tRNA A-37 threonylcarbamoyl transferase component Bud32